jgi:hypothetical protein
VAGFAVLSLAGKQRLGRKAPRFSSQPKPHRRDSQERPVADRIRDCRHEVARGHRRVYTEPIEQLRDQDSAERTKMAGKEPANVVSSAMARHASVDKGGGRAAEALVKPVVIVKRCIGLETRT